jgi:hypothetical protein
MRNQLDREHGESGDGYDRVVVRLHAKWRIVECRAGIQWILQRRKSASDGNGWSARSFCRTSEALRRVAAEHAGAIDPEAQEALDRLPEWIEDVDQPVRHEDHPREGPPSPTGAQTRTPTRPPPPPGSPGPPSALSRSRSTSPTRTARVRCDDAIPGGGIPADVEARHGQCSC